jgi:hypothetical protein
MIEFAAQKIVPDQGSSNSAQSFVRVYRCLSSAANRASGTKRTWQPSL